MKRILLLTAVLWAAPASGHHSFGVYFDADKPVKLSGIVTKVDWRNPHTHLYLDVKDDSGKVVTWTLEGYPPNVLARTGWKKDVTVKVGDAISIFGWRARDGSPSAHLREATPAQCKPRLVGPPPGTREGAAVAGQ